MAGNKNLHTSRASKADEFYTQQNTVEDELQFYTEHFAGKVVLCNCDDPYESEFFKYFALYFNALGLKKLIATCYAGSPIVQTELDFFGTQNENPSFDKHRQAIRFDVTEVKDWNGDGYEDLRDVELLLKTNRNVVTYLDGDGDFRSSECVAALHEADIVVTNPPFSLMKKYLPFLVDSGKKFLVLGNMNHVTFKEIFPYFMNNTVWLGYNSGHFWFKVPDYYEEKATDFKVDADGQKWRRMGNICWFTNLDFKKRHEPLILTKRYSPEEFPRYDNYDAINVDRTADIPMDYWGVMGVPMTFLAQHCPEQFEVLGILTDKRDENPIFAKGTPTYIDDQHKGYVGAVIDGKAIYTRLLIRKLSDMGDWKDD